MPVFGFFGGDLSRLANRGSRLVARGLGLQARKIASPTEGQLKDICCLSKILKKTFKSYQHPVLWV